MQPKILIVDDQPLVLGVFREILSRGPYHVLAVESAEKALQLLEDESVDVVISDERMPGMQGSEFLTIVRNKYPEVVRIILTGHASVESAMRAINESEIFRFLTKPVNSNVLHKAVEDALASRAKGRDTEQHYSLLENLEKQAPGITHVRRDSNGVVIIDEDDD
jgi:DNA-binding NtrC family response regulator